MAFSAELIGISLAANNSFNLTPFTIDLTSEIPRLNALMNNTHLPATALYPGVSPDKGIELDFLAELQNEWLEIFDWETQQAELNEFAQYTAVIESQFAQYTAVIESQTVHFVHVKSAEADTNPLILLHGWPGSFQEFAPLNLGRA
ncbi:epoxide hydrolase [Mycena maculata]|uniref:Epoxide hydrolase n=1 Tax=Mycena maculata TaxID=230809 RepID=A0AAD7NZP2_9AGAR|nr:epoxide hydrolase [Mycena maculata]